MNKYDDALSVLQRAMDAMINEISKCGANGGIGRTQNYAPVFNHLFDAHTKIAALKQISQATEVEQKRGPGRPPKND